MKLIYLMDLKDDGTLHIRNRKGFDQDLKESGAKVFRLTVEKYKAKRSDNANRHYWGCVIVLIQEGLKEIGYRMSKEDVHLFLKSRFNYKELVNPDTSEVIPIPQTTTTLNKMEFADYVEQCKQFSIEWLGVTIPEANSQQALTFEE